MSTRADRASQPASGRVVVVGSLNMDLIVTVEAIPAPGQTVLASQTRRACGGKGANQAVAAARAGAQVTMVGAVGDDADGAALLDALAAEGIDVDGVLRSPEPTGLALVTVDAAGENAITVAPGANHACPPAHVTATLRSLTAADVLVAQGEIPAESIEAAARAASAAGARFLLNLAPAIAVSPGLWRHVSLLVVNEHECAWLLEGLDHEPSGSPAARLAGALGVAVLVTLGTDGSHLVDPSPGTTLDEALPAFAAPQVVDTTGAGDAFVGALAAAWCAGHDLPDAARWGAAAGSLAVRASGAQGGRATPEAILAVLRDTSEPSER
ncbi:ribokinase [Cellulomonas chengniuliangii]|uniref:ribokinase n=1 Tax=Cellulomonas chengniuliangii TaxID=2968084 RepID=UPI001D0F42A6|nr:ribokinase [Cellulomonas chengniuliangii]MCC2318837.1 ribokinase [Cellulomonas chengniuliangii]